MHGNDTYSQTRPALSKQESKPPKYPKDRAAARSCFLFFVHPDQGYCTASFRVCWRFLAPSQASDAEDSPRDSNPYVVPGAASIHVRAVKMDTRLPVALPPGYIPVAGTAWLQAEATGLLHFAFAFFQLPCLLVP
jgi:hypothetical protein